MLYLNKFACLLLCLCSLFQVFVKLVQDISRTHLTVGHFSCVYGGSYTLVLVHLTLYLTRKFKCVIGIIW